MDHLILAITIRIHICYIYYMRTSCWGVKYINYFYYAIITPRQIYITKPYTRNNITYITCIMYNAYTNQRALLKICCWRSYRWAALLSHWKFKFKFELLCVLLRPPSFSDATSIKFCACGQCTWRIGCIESPPTLSRNVFILSRCVDSLTR